VQRGDYEAELEPLVSREGIGVISYYGLASGFLTGKYRSQDDLAKSARGRGVAKYLNNKGLGVLGVLDEVSDKLNATPAQVALAWIMARPSVTAPIASATSVEQLEELAGAATITLDEQTVAALDDASV